MSDELDAAGRILARQQSLITTSQAATAGIGKKRCQRLVDRGFWERLDLGVYGPAGVPMTWRRRLMLGLLLAPDGSLGSHRSSAALLGVGEIHRPKPEITIPRGTTLRRPWLVVHESTDLDLADRRQVEGIPITGPRRLAMDLGAVVSPSGWIATRGSEESPSPGWSSLRSTPSSMPASDPWRSTGSRWKAAPGTGWISPSPI
jgi:hypothetical protein